MHISCCIKNKQAWEREAYANVKSQHENYVILPNTYQANVRQYEIKYSSSAFDISKG